MKNNLLDDNEIPCFSWDRKSTVGVIKERLATASGFDWVKVVSWIMREAAFADVWQFLNAKDVRDHLAELEPFLGRKKDFWKYIIGAWHELGRI